MEKEKEQWIMVMNRLKDGDHNWGLDTAYSITTLGKEKALSLAKKKLSRYKRFFPNLEGKLQEGEW